MNVLFAMLGMGILFGLFGLVRHKDCGGNCGSCGSNTCESKSEDPSA